LDFPNHLSADFAGDGSAFDLHVPFGFGRSNSATIGVLVYQLASDSFLLCAIPGRGLERRGLCVRAGEKRAMASALVAVPPTLLLSPGDVLRDDQISLDRNSRRRCGLGQAGKKSDRGSAAVKE